MRAVIHQATRLAAALLIACAPAALAQVTPVLSALSPTQTVPQLASIALSGSNLQQAGFATTVRFNGVLVAAADMLSLAPDRVVVLAPVGAASGPVIVSVGAVGSNALGFSATDSPYTAAEVVFEPRPGASIARVLAATGLSLRNVVPQGTTASWRLGIPDSRGIPQAIRDLFLTGLANSASATFLYTATALPSRHNQPAPNDPGFAPAQWGPQRVRVVDSDNTTPDAHRLARGTGVTIAVVDTGVDPGHEDLAVVAGTNFTVPAGDPNRGNIADDAPHGTHVAGIAAARTNNGIGIAGVAPGSSLLAIKVLGGGPLGNAADTIAAGVHEAVRRKAKVINMSLGGPANQPALEQAVRQAVGRKSVVVISSGNGGRLNGPDTACFPAALSDPLLADGIVAVGNTTELDAINLGARDPGPAENPCNFFQGGSTRGNHVDVAAPGTAICSSVPAALPGDPPAPGVPPLCRAPLNAVASPYREFTGTSMAAPHVSGIAAMMLERDPALSPTQVECLLRITSVDLGPRGKDPAFGDGRVDAYASVLSVIALNKRYELLPRDCNGWKAAGGPPPVSPPLPPLPPLPLPTPPGVAPGFANPDQVLPVTSNSRLAAQAASNGSTVIVDLATLALNSFAGSAVSDVVITPDDQTALVSEFSGVDVSGQMRRVRLASMLTDTVVVQPPVTEITVTPDSRRALVGTVEDLTVVDLNNFTPAGVTLYDIDVITAVSVTPDSQRALVGEPAGVVMLHLPSGTLTRVATGTPVTGISVTPTGTQAVVGIAGGVAVIGIPGGGFASVLAGSPLSTIGITPSGGMAVYATLGGVVLVDLASLTTRFVPTPAPVTNVDLAPNGLLGLVGTAAGASIIDLVAGSATHLVLPLPLQSGVTISPDSHWGTVGTPLGVSVIDLFTRTGLNVATALPVTNVSIAPNSLQAIVGTVAGAALLNLPAATASPLAMARALVAATIAPDSTKAVIGTHSGFSVITLPAVASVEVSPTPPMLNFLPDDTQPPLNASGGRGRLPTNDG